MGTAHVTDVIDSDLSGLPVTDQEFEIAFALGKTVPCVSRRNFSAELAAQLAGPRFEGCCLVSTEPRTDYDDESYFTSRAEFIVAAGVDPRGALVACAAQYLIDNKDADLDAPEFDADDYNLTAYEVFEEVDRLVLWRNGVLLLDWDEIAADELDFDDQTNFAEEALALYRGSKK